MIKQFVIFGFFLSFPLLTNAQEMPDSVTLKKFVAIYMEEKKLNEELAYEYQSKISQLNIETSNYNEFLKYKKAGKQLPSELIFIEDEVNKLKSQYLVQKEDAIRDLCGDNSLDYNVFLELEKRYLGEIKFNRACMKYIMDYFNSELDE